MTTTNNDLAYRFVSFPSLGWRRFAIRASMGLWRLGLGPLVGEALMLLTIDAPTGPQRTVLEYHAAGDKLYVTCAFCARAPWYQHLQARPHVTIQTARGAASVQAERVTDPDELVQVYHLMRRRDPAMLNWYFDSLGIGHTHEAIRANRDRLHWLRFAPTQATTPPPLRPDLVWIWPVMLAGLWLLRRHLSAG